MRRRKLTALLLSLFMLFGSVGAAAAEPAEAPDIRAAGNPAGSWFYDQLTSQGKRIYDVILAAFEDGTMNDGASPIDLIETDAANTAAVQAYLNGDRTLFDDFAAAKDAFDLEHPEAWFIDLSDLSFRVTTDQDGTLYATIGTSREDNYYVNGVDSAAGVKTRTDALNTAIGSIVDNAPKNGADYEIVQYVHDQITHGISYRFEQDCTGDNAGFIRTSYALVTHEGVCEAYVRSFQMAMNELGIPCVPIHGLQTSGTPEQHMWCAVRINDEWYAVDPTWDDPVALDAAGNIKVGVNGSDGGETETYLLVGQDVIGANWKPSGFVSTSGFEFTYPEIAMMSYGSGVLERGGLKIEYARDVMEDTASTVYRVSYNGDGLVEAAKKGYYFLVKLYDVNADGSVDKFDDWYYSVHGLHAVQDYFDPDNDFRNGGNKYFADTENYLIYNISNCEYAEFAITTKAPPAWESAMDLITMGGYFSGDEADILAESGLIYNENANYEQPPYVKNASPGFNTPVYAGKAYAVHIEFTDALYHPDQNSVDNAVAGKVNDAEKAMGQIPALDYRGTTYNWGVNGQLPHTFADKPDPTNIRWTCEEHGIHDGMSGIDSACRITALDYAFTSSRMWADDSVQYEFFLTGLVGVKSNRFPNNWSYVFHNDYPFTTCPLCSPFRWNMWGQPQALNNPDELDLSKLTVQGVDGYEESLAALTERMNLDPYDMNGRLMLVVENLDGSRSSAEELANAISDKDVVKDGDVIDAPAEAVLGSSLFEIDFARVCAKTIVKSGQSVRVCLGFPEGIDASMSGIVFKAYHFTRNDAGDIVSVEEIPLSVTPYGLVVECMSFSPFEVVALDAGMVSGLERDTGRPLVLTVEGHGSVLAAGGESAGSVISFQEGEERTFTVKADDGYAIDTVSFSGSKTVGGDTITLGYDDLDGTGAILSVTFAAASVKEAEEEAGLTAAAPAPCVHANTTKTDYKAPTCTEKGYTSLVECDDCHTILSRAEEISATGHVESAAREGYVAAECGKEGYTGTLTCSVCGEVLSEGEIIPALEHKYVNGVCIYCQTPEPGDGGGVTPSPSPSPSPSPGPSGGSGSSGGRGGSAGTSSAVSRPETGGGSTTVGVTATAATSGTTASAAVNSSTMNSAVSSAVAEAARQGTAPVVEVEVRTSAAAESLNVSLPAASLETLAKAEDSFLVISSGVGGVTLDHTALAALAGGASAGTVTFKVAPVADSALSTAQREAVDGASVVDVSLLSGSAAIHDFGGGTITVSLPYTLKPGERGDELVVCSLDDDGGLTACATSYEDGRVIFTTAHLSKYVIATRALEAGGAAFVDVDAGAYYAGAVAWAVENNVTRGTDDTHFSPDNGCTRAQFVTFLWRAAGSPAPASYENPFSDVSAAGYTDYYDAILWAAGRGIALGTGDGTTFQPDAGVLRAQAVTFMCRYARQAGIASETGTPAFDDVSGTGTLAPYYDAIGWAAANGITNGNGDNTFGPMEACSRGMMITFLHRLFSTATA